MGVLSAERAPVRDRDGLQGVFSASREGKRLNMLGFNTNNLLENGRDNQAQNSLTNDRHHGAAAELTRTYGTTHIP